MSHRILRGEKPDDLPVQFSRKFEMVVNRGAATALGTPIDSGARGPDDRSVGCGRGGLLSLEKADEKCSSCDPHSNLECGGARSQTQERAAGTFHKIPQSPGGARVGRRSSDSPPKTGVDPCHRPL